MTTQEMIDQFTITQEEANAAAEAKPEGNHVRRYFLGGSYGDNAKGLEEAIADAVQRLAHIPAFSAEFDRGLGESLEAKMDVTTTAATGVWSSVVRRVWVSVVVYGGKSLRDTPEGIFLTGRVDLRYDHLDGRSNGCSCGGGQGAFSIDYFGRVEVR